jgi:hypothetical protein
MKCSETAEGASLATDRDRADGALMGRAGGDAACPDLVGNDEPVGSADPVIGRTSRPIATDHCAKFERRLIGWSGFENAARSDEPHWFKDLLSVWRPSGHCSGAAGLRIAIRNGYLNFYRLGQSIARVACVSGSLIAEVHYKYVSLDEPQPGMSKSPYLRLTTNGVFFQDTRVAAYEGLATLHKWIAAAGEYAGDEKSIVDELVEKNDHVVDLEMAIPAWARSKVAVRMDLVAIEEGTVVFWEAKTVNDGRIRCRAEFEADKSPHVLEQLYNYRVFLEQGSHLEQVELAYRNTAKLLVKLRALADGIGPTLALGRRIVDASQADRLSVAPSAALVVVDLPADNKRAWTSWKASHEGKLLGKIPMRVLESPGPLVFAGAQ